MARKRQTPSPHKAHDHSYRLLFSHPDMVADLLRGYINQPWVEQLDFTTLSRAPDNYITDDLRERKDDIIWRVRWRDDERWLYIYLLLEFQSSSDSWMAVRVLTYVGLLYAEIIKAGDLTSAGKLPPVLPIVLYNGNEPWKGLTDISELIDRVPGGLDRYRPSLEYLLLDENAYADTPLPEVRNLVSALFSLENCRSPEDMQQLLERLIDWLALPQQLTLRRHFTIWLKRVLLPAKMDGINFNQLNDLQEINSMLSERVKSWKEDWMERRSAEAREDAERGLLHRQLTRRFGPLDEQTETRLQQATTADLERWADNILDARTLDEVFTTH